MKKKKKNAVIMKVSFICLTNGEQRDVAHTVSLGYPRLGLESIQSLTISKAVTSVKKHQA